MINDYLEIRNAEGMPKLVDATMSLGFLLNAKSGVRNCAIALTESSQTATQIASLDLFPGDTSRLGTFATPEK